MCNDKKQFKELFDVISEYYNAQKPSTDVLRMYYAGLDIFSIDQIQRAAINHMTNSKNGQFFPKITDLKKYLEGLPPTPDEIIASARNKKTPLGILAAIHIGSYDLDNQNEFYLRQRAHEILELFPILKNKFNQNKLTQHEQSTMKKYNVSLDSHFQKIGESKNAEVVMLEYAKTNLKVASSISKLANSKRTRPQKAIKGHAVT